MGFPRQEYWSGLPCPPPAYVLNPGIENASLKSPALAGEFFTTNATWEPSVYPVVVVVVVYIPLYLLVEILK